MSNSDHVIMCNGDLLLQLACNLLDAPELRRVGEHLIQLAYDVEKAERLERKREWLRDQQDGHDDSAADADPAPEVEDSNAAEDFAWENDPDEYEAEVTEADAPFIERRLERHTERLDRIGAFLRDDAAAKKAR
ncbi:MAG: hypothetical protein ACLPKT_01265 [Methylocella sp.]